MGWDRTRGGAYLGNRHLVHGMKQWVDLIVFFALSCRKTLALTGDSFTSRLLL